MRNIEIGAGGSAMIEHLIRTVITVCMVGTVGFHCTAKGRAPTHGETANMLALLPADAPVRVRVSLDHVAALDGRLDLMEARDFDSHSIGIAGAVRRNGAPECSEAAPLCLSLEMLRQAAKGLAAELPKARAVYFLVPARDTPWSRIAEIALVLFEAHGTTFRLFLVSD